MTSVGETLRRERLRQNLDLDAVSRELKISSRMLEAIEAEKFDKLPGGVFTKSFVRQYARFLRLDEDELAAEVSRTLGSSTQEMPKFAETAKVNAPIAVPRVQKWEAVSDRGFSWSSPLPAAALVVVVIMGCSGVYAWWQRTRHPVLAQSSQETAKSTAPVQPPVVPQAVPQQPVTDPTQAPAPVQTAPPNVDQPLQSAQPQAQAPPVQPAAPPAAVPAVPTGAAPAPQASLPSNPNASVRVQVTADEPVWLLAKSDGKYLFSGTLDTNQSRTVEANGAVTLRLGNAGGVSILLNGKPVGIVGPKGQVRTVQFTPTGFQVVTAPKTTPMSDPLIDH